MEKTKILSSWDTKINALQEYKSLFGVWPRYSDTYKDMHVGRMLSHFRYRYKRGVLAENKSKQLEDMGIVLSMNNRDESWQGKLRSLQTFLKAKELYQLAKKEYLANGIDNWCTQQRLKYRDDSIQPERLDELQNLGFVFSKNKRGWL